MTWIHACTRFLSASNIPKCSPSYTPLVWRADSEVRLHKKCRELNAEIVANAAKVQTALKLNEEDQGTIAALKKEIEKAWKMVDARCVHTRTCGCWKSRV